MQISIQSKNLYKKLQKQYSRKINLDLKRISNGLKKLNNLHNNINNPINIIGSDGKYSTLKSLQSFIEQNGQKVSTFTSPHLYDLRHRFWLKDKFITLKELKKNIKIIRKLKIKLTLFELLTLVYFISAAKLKNTSYSLVEAGLLFSKDSTRVWNHPRCQIITNINKQHLEWVKPRTLDSICKEKVGYLSKKTNIYIGKQNKNTLKIIKKILKKNPSTKLYYGKDWTLKKVNKKIIFKDKKGKLILQSKKILSDGIWQNVGLAIKVARDLNIPKKQILKAVPRISFEGRVQYIEGKLTKQLHSNEKLLVDGCHSPTSARNLVSYLKTLNKDLYGIWGMQKHKNPDIFIKNFKGLFKGLITVRIPDEKNSCNPYKLKKLANQVGIHCETAKNIKSAITKLSTKKEKVIICFGSLYLIGKVLSLN